MHAGRGGGGQAEQGQLPVRQRGLHARGEVRQPGAKGGELQVLSQESYREEVGGDRKRARSEQQEVWARVGQGLEQELESLATCCDSTRLQFPAWPHTPSREIILDLVKLLQTSNLSLAEVRERLTGRDAHGRQLELDRVRNKM